MQDTIQIKGARTHNLKDIDLEVPRNTMIAFTGLSGSGKSSLAFDTIFAEGQRRYVESLSSYARQFIQQMQKPEVDEINGLSPAISIDQSSRSNNPRSTVATITDIYDYLRVLYARVGTPHCLECGRPIKKMSVDEIKNAIVERVSKKISHQNESGEVTIFAPVVRGRKGEYYQLLYDLLSYGFTTVLVDGEKKNLREEILLERNKKHDIDLLIDTISLDEFTEDMESAEERLADSLEQGLKRAEGLVRVVFSKDQAFTTHQQGKNDLGELFSSQFTCPHDGYSFPEVEPRLFSFNSPYGACDACKGIGTASLGSDEVCSKCEGARLREEALHVLLESEGETMNIDELTQLPIDAAQEFVEGIMLSETQTKIAKTVLQEIISRLQFMINVGIEYLTLNRRANTLSGGEAQRIRLASQLGSRLVGALYVLDEPTIGLHMRDNERLINTLKDLRDIGNTIIVVEHDENTIFSSDYIVDLGPGAGRHGGEIVVDGYLNDLLDDDADVHNSLTLQYLRGEREIPVPQERRTQNQGHLKIRGGNKFNISDLDVDIPLGRLIAITGVSGSGKSTLMHEIIYKNAQSRLHRRGNAAEKLENCESFSGTEYLSRTVMIDQSPIGRTSRSNPATYTGIWGPVRELFASTKEARVRGWDKGRFSFNTEGGRCEACGGKGEIKVEMHFLPTVYVDCDVCHGKRFTEETLEAEYNGKNIYEILQLTVDEAAEFFEDIPKIHDRLETLQQVGLGYIRLGQPSTTLSGGEAQRVKISSELYRRHTQKTLYLLDEPTVGLHYEDIRKLIDILQMLVDKGNTVMVIEHNMDVIKSTDYIIDMGPEGGEGGGTIVAKGTPKQVAETETATAEFLKKHLS